MEATGSELGGSTGAGETAVGTATDTGGMSSGSTAVDSTTATDGEGDTASDTAAGECGCGLSPGVGLWCGFDLTAAPAAQQCPPSHAELNGQPCATAEPLVTPSGCCLGDGTVVFCDQDLVVVVDCTPETVEDCGPV